MLYVVCLSQYSASPISSVSLAGISYHGLPIVVSLCRCFPAHSQVSSNILLCSSLVNETDSGFRRVSRSHASAFRLLLCSHALSSPLVVRCVGTRPSSCAESTGVAPSKSGVFKVHPTARGDVLRAAL